MNRRDLVLAGLLALGVFVVYVLTLAPDVLPGDSGEFQLAVPLLGIVHPTGYPLYLLLAKLLTLIPVGNIAYRVNLFSAASAALAVGAFYLSALGMVEAITNRRLASPSLAIRGESAVAPTSHPCSLRLAATALSLTLAFSLTFWSQATMAEVYALNAFFVIALLGLSMKLRESPSFQAGTSGSKWQWLALALGLSLAHHRTTILVVPVLAVYLFPYMGLRAVWKRALLLAVFPLLMYLYTPLRYDASPYLQTRLDDQHVIVSLEPSPAAFLGHFLGIGFRGALRWDGRSVERLSSTLPRAAAEFTLAGVLLALVGIGALIQARRWRLLFLFLALSIAYTLFNALYQIGDISDFYTPLYILISFLMLAGTAWLSRLAFSRGFHCGFAAVLLALPVVLLLARFGAGVGDHDNTVRARWQSLLSPSLPAGAILISNDRDEMTPLLYLQSVEGVRRDAAGLYPLISTDPRHSHVVSLTQYALVTARPVYFIKPMDGLSIKFRVQPEGTLVRVLGLQDNQPQVTLVRDSSLVRFAGWSRSATSGPRAPLVISLYWQPLGTARPDLKSYVHFDRSDGRTVAQSDHTPGGEFYPPSEWQAGDTLRDSHTMIPSADLPAGDYQLVAGAYQPDGQSIDGVGHIELGPITVGP